MGLRPKYIRALRANLRPNHPPPIKQPHHRIGKINPLHRKQTHRRNLRLLRINQTNQSAPTSRQRTRRPMPTSKDVIDQHKRRFPGTTLTDNQIAQKHEMGQVINPQTGRFIQTNSIEERDVVLTYLSYNPNTSMTAHQILRDIAMEMLSIQKRVVSTKPNK